MLSIVMRRYDSFRKFQLMRFSLQSLAIVVLFAALVVSAVTKFRSAASKTAEAGAIRQNLPASQRSASQTERTQALRHSRQQLTTALERHKSLTERLAPAFQREVDKFKIVPKNNAFSIRTIPMLKQPGGFAMKYGVYVPDNRRVSVAMDTVDPTPKEADFVNSDPVVVRLLPGHRELTVTFAKEGEFDSTRLKPRKQFFRLAVDDELVAEFEYAHEKSSGGGYSSTTFTQQTEFQPKQIPGELLSYRPSPGDCAVRVRLIEDDE